MKLANFEWNLLIRIASGSSGHALFRKKHRREPKFTAGSGRLRVQLKVDERWTLTFAFGQKQTLRRPYRKPAYQQEKHAEFSTQASPPVGFGT
jgi:hypothetical protein